VCAPSLRPSRRVHAPRRRRDSVIFADHDPMDDRIPGGRDQDGEVVKRPNRCRQRPGRSARGASRRREAARSPSYPDARRDWATSYGTGRWREGIGNVSDFRSIASRPSAFARQNSMEERGARVSGRRLFTPAGGMLSAWPRKIVADAASAAAAHLISWLVSNTRGVKASAFTASDTMM